VTARDDAPRRPRSRATRRALGLYGVLLVLPTLVFGALYWGQLVSDYKNEVAALPRVALNAKERIVSGMRERVNRLLVAESRRPFYQYGRIFSPEEVVGDRPSIQESPLVADILPEGVLAWFGFDMVEGPDGGIELFLGANEGGAGVAKKEAHLRKTVEEFRLRKFEEGIFTSLSLLEGLEPRDIPLASVAVLRGQDGARDCLLRFGEEIAGLQYRIGVSPFELFFYLADGKTPRAFVSRRVVAFPSSSPLPEVPCIEDILGETFSLQQGFLVDVKWLLHDLPQSEARKVLGEEQELLSLGPSYDDLSKTKAHLYPISEMGFSTAQPEERWYGQLEVAVENEAIDRRFEAQSRRFLLVALMLVISLATGMALLYRSVDRELEQAHRMQNFVAAVTHELRTPLSTIRLHGEMLAEGWAQDPEQKKEYYARILRETDRLSTLVENILEKSRLSERRVEPVAEDVNRILEALRPSLSAPDGSTDDLAFDLQADLPPAWLTPEAVAGIATNLVENARKYAPVRNGSEPILLRTRGRSGRVVLEVADRGPGVPTEEREKIFEAFYRVGSEATRQTKGTGLGLHLVRLHAESIGAEASYEPRDGGGSVFQVAFRSGA